VGYWAKAAGPVKIIIDAANMAAKKLFGTLHILTGSLAKSSFSVPHFWTRAR
jgi:hypothetical protein